jgi:hypothetical protein
MPVWQREEVQALPRIAGKTGDYKARVSTTTSQTSAQPNHEDGPVAAGSSREHNASSCGRSL